MVMIIQYESSCCYVTWRHLGDINLSDRGRMDTTLKLKWRENPDKGLENFKYIYLYIFNLLVILVQMAFYEVTLNKLSHIYEDKTEHVA